MICYAKTSKETHAYGTRLSTASDGTVVGQSGKFRDAKLVRQNADESWEPLVLADTFQKHYYTDDEILSMGFWKKDNNGNGIADADEVTPLSARLGGEVKESQGLQKVGHHLISALLPSIPDYAIVTDVYEPFAADLMLERNKFGNVTGELVTYSAHVGRSTERL